MRVLSVDLGLAACGYVVCEVDGMDTRLIKDGQITPPRSLGLVDKLGMIFEGLEREIDSGSIQYLIVEKLYSHHKHPVTLGELSQVRGVIALLAHQKKLGFFECAPVRARKAFLGRGSCKSEQVRKMAESITGRKFISKHSADAFSLVTAFAAARKMDNLRMSLKRQPV